MIKLILANGFIKKIYKKIIKNYKNCQKTYIKMEKPLEKVQYLGYTIYKLLYREKIYI